MRRILLAIAFAVALLPALARAAETAPAAPPREYSQERLLTIAVGVVVGALVLHGVGLGDLGTVAGGFAGGIAANWWYRNGGDRTVRATLKSSFERAVQPTLLLRTVASR